MVIFMLILLISNTLNLRKDQPILFSRIVMVSLVVTSFLAFNNLFFLSLDKGIGIFGGLFHVTVFTQIFSIFIFLISAMLLTLTSFYPRKVFLNKISLSFVVFKLGGSEVKYNKTKLSNRKIMFFTTKRNFSLFGNFYKNLRFKFIAIWIKKYALSLVFDLNVGLFLISLTWPALFSIWHVISTNYMVSFICVFSNTLLLAFFYINLKTSKRKNYLFKFKKIKSILKIIYKKFLFIFNEIKINWKFHLGIFFISSCLIVGLRYYLITSLHDLDLYFLIYIYIVMFPYAVLVNKTLSLYFKVKLTNDKLTKKDFFFRLFNDSIQAISLKNFAAYLICIAISRTLLIFAQMHFNYYIIHCDSKPEYVDLWLNKNAVIFDKKPENVRNYIHSNLHEIYRQTFNLNYILKSKGVHSFNIYELVENVPVIARIMYGVPLVTGCAVDDQNLYQNNPNLNNFPHYLQYNGHIYSISKYKELLKSFNTQTIEENSYRLPDNIFSKAIELDGIFAPNRYNLGISTSVEESMSNHLSTYEGYLEEIKLLNKAKDYLINKNYLNKNAFETWQKRQINWYTLDGFFPNDAWSWLAHESKQQPNSGLHIKMDFTNELQTYNEILENLLYVQLVTLENEAVLNYFSKSPLVRDLLIGNPPLDLRGKYLRIIHQDLSNIVKLHRQEYKYFYGFLHFAHYEQYNLHSDEQWVFKFNMNMGNYYRETIYEFKNGILAKYNVCYPMPGFKHAFNFANYYPFNSNISSYHVNKLKFFAISVANEICSTNLSKRVKYNNTSFLGFGFGLPLNFKPSIIKSVEDTISIKKNKLNYLVSLSEKEKLKSDLPLHLPCDTGYLKPGSKRDLLFYDWIRYSEPGSKGRPDFVPIRALKKNFK